MESWPRISVVTPSFNQAKYIRATIESVLDQNYPNVEHIVIDGGSTDGTLEILERFPHLHVVCERDRGHADAVNKGFRLATGDIFGFLNSDDTLVPGALLRIARAIDPRQGPHIVMGRCRFIDEQGQFIGIEHPSRFEGHRRVLEVWKGHTIPQPAVFWTRQVWQAYGPMDDHLKTAWIDYDLFCRFSQRYHFQFVDEVFATYRLHSESKTERWTDADRLEDSIRLSRRYWGSPLTPMRWRLALSLALFRLNRVGRARSHLRQAEEAWRDRQAARAVTRALIGVILAPGVAFYVGVYPRLRDQATGIWRKGLERLAHRRPLPPHTAVYLDRTECWNDGWVGPRLMVDRKTALPARAVGVKGWVDLRYLRNPLVLTVRVDRQVVGRYRILRPGDFVAHIPLLDPLPSGAHTLEVEASTWFVPHLFTGNGDYRPLAWRMSDIELEAAP